MTSVRTTSGRSRADRREGDLAVDGRLHRPVRGEHARQVLAHVGVVVHDQDARRPLGAVDQQRDARTPQRSTSTAASAFGSQRSASSTNRLSAARVATGASASASEDRVGRARRNRDCHRRAPVHRALRRDVAAQQARELVHQREPDAGPFLRARPRAGDAVESVEDVRQLVRGDPDARVGDLELDVARRERRATRAPCPSKVNFRAFEIRFSRIFSHMSGSIRTGSGSGSQLTSYARPASRIADVERAGPAPR